MNLTRERALELMEAIREMQIIKKEINNYVLEPSQITIDTDIQMFLKGFLAQEWAGARK